MSPSFISFFPEHRFGSQCPKSQHAALKEGRDAGWSSSSSSFRGPLALGALLYFLPLDEKLSFLCRTIVKDIVFVKKDRDGKMGCSKTLPLSKISGHKVYCTVL
jgi:hypothetical protein